MARLIIIGGKAKQETKLERVGRGMMREAILVAVRAAYNAGRQMVTGDLQAATRYSAAGNVAADHWRTGKRHQN